MSSFVSVGNATQPFTRLLDAVFRIADKLPQPVLVQTGNTPWIRSAGCISRPFLDMEEFDHQVKSAGLLIMHAGAGSVIHAIKAGKVPVVMPRLARYGEIIDDHQLEFGRALAGVGKIVLAEEAADLSSAVATAIERQRGSGFVGREPPLVELVGSALRRHAGRVRS